MPPHREILEAGVQQGLAGESDPERVQGWRVERKIKSCPAGLFKKKIVCDDGQNLLGGEILEIASGSSGVCRQTAVKPQFSKRAVYASKECS